MVDVPLSRKSVSRVLLVVGLLLFGPQVQTGDQPVAPSFWDSFRSFTQPIVTDYLQPAASSAADYWVEAARSYRGSSLQNAPLVSNTWGNPLMPTPEAAPVQIAAPQTQSITPLVDYSPNDFANPHVAPSSATFEPDSSALVANLSQNTQPAIVSPTGFNYESLLTKTNMGLAGLSILGAISVYAYKKRSAAIEKLNQINDKYEDVIRLFVKDDGEFFELSPAEETLNQAASKYIRKKYQSDFSMAPAKDVLCPLLSLIEDLANSIKNLPAPSVIYGLGVYNKTIKMHETLAKIKEDALQTRECGAQLTKLKNIQEKRRLAADGKLPNE
ncbi:MAG: hypothetical protein IT346_00970 [Epsilonproteobacteria bacterium]|nr:hypothetical protein [Campylobacterota bacterium]